MAFLDRLNLLTKRLRVRLGSSQTEPVRPNVPAPDIKSLQLAAEALARSEERLRLAMEATAFGTFEWDIVTNHVHCSPNVKMQLGLSSDDVLGLEDVLVRIHPEDREAVRRTISSALNPQGPRTYAGEFRTLLPDGRTAWIDARGAVLFTDLGTRAQCMVGIVLDITERRQREQQLHDTAAELGTANRMKDEFMATLAHELRNPLTPIRNGLEILALQGLTNPTQRHACDIMNRQVTHLARLVNDLIDVSRITRRKLVLKKEIVTAQSIVQSVVDTLQPQLEAARHHLQLELGSHPIWLYADSMRIVQAVGNLLANSVRYTPAGGHIRIGLASNATLAEISVSDNGIGISAQMLPHVFDMFTQDTERHSEAGLGIGLALAKALVEMHGGGISAQSAGIGCGATFCVSLPAAESRHVQSTVSAAMPATHGLSPRRKILVVDDNVDAADSTAALLSLLGHEVHEAFDGQEAVHAAEIFAPDLILMDIGMPGLDGYQALLRIRRLALPRQPVIVATTGWGPESAHGQASDLDFDARLLKPVATSDIERVLAQLVSDAPRPDDPAAQLDAAIE
ncbi:MAG: ATP-binding protein [Gammaproteobacteria bacterium]